MVKDAARYFGGLIYMLVVPYIPFIFVLAGLVVYALSTNARAAELGRLSFAVGLLVWLLHLGGK